MSTTELRYRAGRWCRNCKKEIYNSVCPTCGGAFIDLKHTVDPFASIEETLTPCKRVLWKPWTWTGKTWVVTGTK